MAALETIKAISVIAKPFIEPIVQIWLKPKLEQLYKESGLEKKVLQHVFENSFEEYLTRSYRKNAILNTIVFQNQQKKIHDLYLPLTLKKAGGAETFLIDHYRDDLVPQYRRVLISDTAGMGKSTITKWLFLSCIEENKGIPIFIELRKLSKKRGILDEILNELNAIDKEIDADFVLRLIRKGDFIFFLDGYDEIPNKDREAVTRDLQDFISKAADNYFVLASRPESALAAFGDFQQFNIQPLKVEEAFELIKKYDADGSIAEELIKKIEGKVLEDLREFLSNPLLVSLLYKAYSYKPTIPFKKHIFYRQVYDALFESHDLTKGGAFVREKYSGLDIEDFHRVMRALGFTTVKSGKIEYDKDELLKLIRSVKNLCPGISFSPAKLLRDLVVTVPLLYKEGQSYRWAHKSIQEYFAAQFICVDSKAKQEAILMRMYANDESSKYYNILDICYDIDYKTFRHVIINDLTANFIDYHDSSFVWARQSEISKKDIDERKSLTFGTESDWVVVGLGEQLEVLESPLSMGHRRSIEIGIPMGDTRALLINLLTSYFTDMMELLYTKKEPIMHVLASSYRRLENIDLPVGKWYKLDDVHESPLNRNPKIFSIVNEIMEQIFSHNKPGRVVLDIKKCRKVKNEIDKEIARERSEDFLLGDL